MKNVLQKLQTLTNIQSDKLIVGFMETINISSF